MFKNTNSENSPNSSSPAYHSIAPTTTITVDEALAKAGGFGRFQCFLFFVVVLSMNSAGFIVMGVAYYELDPPYLCTYLNNTSSVEFEIPCPWTEVCHSSSPYLISYRIDTG